MSLSPTEDRHSVLNTPRRTFPLKRSLTCRTDSSIVTPDSQSIKREPSPSDGVVTPPSSSHSSGIRLNIKGDRITVVQCSQSAFSVFPADDEDLTDSDIDISPPARKKVVTAATMGSGKKTAVPKKVETTTPQLMLIQPAMKRKTRIVDPGSPTTAALIASASKGGAEIYDSDVEDLMEEVKGTNKPQLFRNVRWGPATTDYSDVATFPSHPEFTQFVPGRWERQPDGSLVDQKTKLIVKLTDKKGNKRIFANPPPKDWGNQEAITALNKRTVQQIRRNTGVRFREVVTAYVQEERRWILANLNKGKPIHGWKRFVDDFNKKFAGKKVEGSVRPVRSHSSLTKEVDRFGPKYYSKGQVPVPVADKDKRKATKNE